MKAKTLNVTETEDFSATVRSPFLGSVDQCIGQRNLTVLQYKSENKDVRKVEKALLWGETVRLRKGVGLGPLIW